MNERIKEMWEEATVSVWPRPGKFTAGEYDYHLAKFAEFIVRECISALDVNIYRSLVGDGDLIRAVLILKEHFGVEE